jgi:hypothetical protein
VKREVQDLLALARARGCAVVPTRNGHYKVLVPGGGLVVVPRTPSDWRSIRNIRSDLRKAGLDI